MTANSKAALAPREKRALIRAARWISHLPIPDTDAERQLQRALVICAAGDPRLHPLILRQARNMQSIAWTSYTGDPLLALSVHGLFLGKGICLPGLAEYSSTIASALPQTPSAASAMLVDLLNRTGHRMPAMALEVLNPPPLEAIVESGLAELLALCRAVMLSTSCGAIPCPNEAFWSSLPALSVHSARGWNIPATCAVLRACAHLRLADSNDCLWARDWLLDQQDRDGRFGLLSAEAKKQGLNPDAWELYFMPTVDAAWALAEMRSPGFLVRSPEAVTTS